MIAILLMTALLHPVHETVSEVEWNPQSKRLEVAIRMHVLDEQWIRRQADREADVSDVAIAYVKKCVRVGSGPESTTTEKTRDTYHWIGREEDDAYVWWYVEIEPADESEPRFLRHSMLFDHHPGYVNRVVVLSRLPKLAQTLTIARPTMDLSPQAIKHEKPASGEPDGGGDLDR